MDFTSKSINKLTTLVIALFGNDSLKWLNTPSKDLDGKNPLELIAEGKEDIIIEFLEDISLGHPG